MWKASGGVSPPWKEERDRPGAARAARTIREGVRAGAGALARLAERTFRAAFAALNTAEDMDLHCTAHYGEARQLAEIADPDMETLVVEHGDDLIAYAQLRRGIAPAGIEAARPVEIFRFYVDQRWHGRGVAHELMSAVLGRAAASDTDTVWLGVWERNPRAIAFYAKWGFAAVGEHTFHLGRDIQRDLVLHRSLEEK